MSAYIPRPILFGINHVYGSNATITKFNEGLAWRQAPFRRSIERKLGMIRPVKMEICQKIGDLTKLTKLKI